MRKQKRNRLLLVEHDDARAETIGASLAHDGWDVVRCGGPSARSCPLIENHDCPIRDRAHAAVVTVRCADDGEVGFVEEISMLCASALDPSVLVIEGSSEPAETVFGNTVIGSSRPVEEIADTLRPRKSRFAFRRLGHL